MTVAAHSSSTALPLQVFYGVAGWLLALNVSHLLDSRVMVRVLTITAIPVVILCTLGAAFLGFLGLMVLLAAATHAPGYDLHMVWSYAAWVIILGGIALTLTTCVSEAKHLYGSRCHSTQPDPSSRWLTLHLSGSAEALLGYRKTTIEQCLDITTHAAPPPQLQRDTDTRRPGQATPPGPDGTYGNPDSNSDHDKAVAETCPASRGRA